MNTHIITTNSNSISGDDNDDKNELYYEKLQFQLQMKEEKFKLEQDKFNVEKEKEKLKIEQNKFNLEKETEKANFKIEQDKFQVKQDKFALEKQQFQHDMKSEKDKFELEKEKFAIEKQKFEEQCEQHTSQLFHHNSLSTFSMIPQTPIISSSMLPSLSQQQQHQQTEQQGEQQPQQEEQEQAEHPHNCNNTFTESNVLLNQHAKVLASVQESIIDYGVQNVEIFDKAMRNLKRRARLLDKKEADVDERSKQLEPYEQHWEELRSENGQLSNEIDQLKKELESMRKVEQERIDKEQIEKERIAKHHAVLKPIFDTNVSSFGARTDLQWMFITIENLNKTILVWFHPQKSLIETLWADPMTALFNILKKDWDNDKIPKVLDNTVKLFVSSRDVLINGKEEWFQISGDGVESSLPPPYTTKSTIESRVKYTRLHPYTQTFDNDRCPQGEYCGENDVYGHFFYHCGRQSCDNAVQCHLAHESTTSTRNASYHIKLKWC